MPEVCVRVRVGAEEYALPIRFVPEVAERGDITPVPGAPSPVLGVRNLRGRVLPVFDLATAVGAAGERDAQRLVVAEAGGLRCALAVDAVLEVAELPDPEEAVESPFLLGAALVDGALIGVIDVPGLLAAITPGAAS
jgi:purine-binding chemotaxis protein CheW